MDTDQAEFLRSKIPAFRRYQPWDSRTDLLVDEIFDEMCEQLCEKTLPGFNVERDTANVTQSQLVQLRQAFDQFRVVSTSNLNFSCCSAHLVRSGW